MLDARIAGIAGHEQYLEIRALPKGVIGELATIHAARHDDISQQQINCALLSRISSAAAPLLASRTR